MPSPTSGAFAALITPIDERGRADLHAFERTIDFVAERGVDGVVIGGGTAEYPHFSITDRAALIGHAVNRLKGKLKVIAAVGTSSIHSTLPLAHQAADSGCDALLVPMPYFFRYQQQDLVSFCETVCGSVSLPCLLYNLPGFTNPLDVRTAVHLLHTVPNLTGMKDSSGDTSHLEPLAKAREKRAFSLFVGDDSLLLGALQAGWDGVISGIASFAPELIVSIYRRYREGKTHDAAHLQENLDAVIDQIVQLPIPWGVRVGLAARGIANGPMHVLPSPQRQRQMDDFGVWLNQWAAKEGVKLDEVWRKF